MISLPLGTWVSWSSAGVLIQCRRALRAGRRGDARHVGRRRTAAGALPSPRAGV